MLIALAGIPRKHLNKIQKEADKIAGTGHSLIPIASVGDDGTVGVEDAIRVSAAIVTAVRRSKDPVKYGSGVLYLTHSWAQSDSFEHFLYPAIVVCRVNFPAGPIVTGGRAGEVYINSIIKSLAPVRLLLIRAVNRAIIEMTSRKNRTPLLLPMRNFKSSTLGPSIRNLFGSLVSSGRPGELIETACAAIERDHPFRSKGDDKGFTDHAGVTFRSPGRDLHGQLWNVEGTGHSEQCTLNGLLRLGGPIAPGFHYDCMRGNLLSGQFQNCHSASGHYRGRPHLNIAPNDFVR